MAEADKLWHHNERHERVEMLSSQSFDTRCHSFQLNELLIEEKELYLHSMSSLQKHVSKGWNLRLKVVFSDLLEVKRADGTRVRGSFALRHRTRQCS